MSVTGLSACCHVVSAYMNFHYLCVVGGGGRHVFWTLGCCHLILLKYTQRQFPFSWQDRQFCGLMITLCFDLCVSKLVM